MNVPVRVVVLGEATGEMQPVHDVLCRQPDVRWLGSARQLSALSDAPDVLVICLRHPDQFAAADVQALIARCPLSRLIAVYGAWCLGDGRTRDAWPLALRVPVAQFSLRFEQEVRCVRGVSRALPNTASRTEIFETLIVNIPAPAPGQQTVAVVSPDRAWREMLEAAVRDAGATVLEPGLAQRIVWDADPDTPERRLDRQKSVAALQAGQSLIDAVGFCHTSVRETCVWKLAPLAEIVFRVLENRVNL